MPIIYLSPSTQENNYYVTGGTEEYYMNRLADAMVPYLVSCGIRYVRNSPDMTAGDAIRQANAGEYDFYLALHSNAAGAGNYGNVRGILAFYYPFSANGKRAAELFAAGLRKIYPLPSAVDIRPTTTLGEVARSRFPAVLLEIGYHDNYEDAVWIETHLTEIAQNLVQSLTEYFSLPFIWPMDPVDGRVQTGSGTLNLRDRPSQEGAVIASMPGGAAVRIYGQWQGWYVVHYGDYVGYAAAEFIRR